jgi:hypothetical protein
MPTNSTVITVITSTIAAMCLGCVATVCALSYWAIQIPPELNTLTGGLVGAVTAMLVKTSPTETQSQPPQPPSTPKPGVTTPVEVVNKPSEPVPTTTQPQP